MKRFIKLIWIVLLSGASLLGAPYTDNGDGTVTDSATGLIWQKCSNGQNNDSTCSGTAGKLEWFDAFYYCKGLSLAGRTWRLPNLKELKTIVDYTKSPTIDITAFPSTQSNIYWSSSTYSRDTSYVEYVFFLDGSAINTKDIGLHFNVRCVTGPSSGASLLRAPYTDNGDGTVTDSATGLIWQKCSNGQNNDSTCSGTAGKLNWKSAITYCNGLSLAGRTWRLPNVDELKTIVDYTKFPTIDITAFPSTNRGNYWSSSNARDTNNANYISFTLGYVYNMIKGLDYYVRCVTGP